MTSGTALPRDRHHRADELEEMLRQWIATVPFDELEELLAANNVPAGGILTAADIAETSPSSRLAATSPWSTTVRATRSPCRQWCRSSPARRAASVTPVRSWVRETDAVLTEVLGLDDAELAELRAPTASSEAGNNEIGVRHRA